MRTIVRRIGTVVTLVTAVLVGAALPAHAHTGLVRSVPADGAELALPPSTVVLTFAEAPLEQGRAVVVTDRTGAHHRLDTRISGTSVRATWSPDIEPGPVTVAYRVVADDGHPIDGELELVAGRPTATEPVTRRTASATAGTAATSEADEWSAGVPTALVALAAAGVVLALAVTLVRRRRTRSG